MSTTSAARTEVDVGGPPRLSHIEGLDGIRGVGMVFMLAYHSEMAWAKGAFLALSQFFTLSGFLVMTILLRETAHSGSLDLRRFWSRRARRLLPAALVALAGIVLFGATVADPSQAEVVPGHILAAFLNVANWVFVTADTGYAALYARPSPVQHFWSLSLEEQFYLLLPLSLLALRRFTTSLRTLAIVFGGIAVVSTLWTAHLIDSDGFARVYYGTDTRLTEMLAGALLAIFVVRNGLRFTTRQRRLVLGAGTVAYAVSFGLFFVVGITDRRMWSGGMAIFSVATALVILAVLVGGGPLRILDWLPFAWTGRLCYGLYLYHFPIFLWLTPERTGLDPWPLFALRVAVTFAAGVPSYYLIETPIRNGRSLGFAPRLQPLAYSVAAAAVVFAGFTVVDRSQETEVLYSEDQQAMPTVETDDGFRILVITDEAGAAVADAVAARAESDPSTEVVRTAVPACRPPGPELRRAGCPEWAGAWRPLIEQHDPDVVLLYLDRWPAGEPPATVPLPEATAAVRDAMVEALDVLSARGAPVLWSRMGADTAEAQRRAADPFHVAMTELLTERDDLRNSVLWKPADEGTPYLADLLIEKLSTQRRREGTPRVMVVGDSQAQSVSYGLELWSAENDGPVIWSAAKGGCSLTLPDRRLSMNEDAEEVPDPACAAVLSGFRDNVDRFDPALVLVLSSLRDLQAVRLEGWDGFRSAGHPEFDDFLLESYVEAVDALSASGAEVVWFLPPCIEYVNVLGGSTEPPRTFDPARLQHLREVILPRLAVERPGKVRLFDLGEHLCPGGEFLRSVPSIGEVRPDGIHLTAESTNWLAERIAPDLFATLLETGG